MITVTNTQQRLHSSGIKPNKALGQHFLTDRTLLADLVSFADVVDGAAVLEIGPGPGGLTQALLESGAAQVIAVEKDERWIQALEPLVCAYRPRLRLIAGDALNVDVTAIDPAPCQIVGNLPYNIASELITRWLSMLDESNPIASITVLIQREVAQRIAANESSPAAYGRISVLANWRAEVILGPLVMPEAFTPPPAVVSQAIKLRLRPVHRLATGSSISEAALSNQAADLTDSGEPTPRVAQAAHATHATQADPASLLHALERVTKAAFGTRRKMIKHSLRSVFGENLDEVLQHCSIESSLRAERVSVTQYAQLARALLQL